MAVSVALVYLGRMARQATFVPGRSCEGCTLCCKLTTVEALNKPRGVMCSHCTAGVGCNIYEQRPNECRDFHCEYRLNSELGEEWKPLTAHMFIMVQSQARAVHVMVDEGFYDAWRAEPYYSEIKVMATNMLLQRGYLVVWEGLECIGVLPHKDVRLGRWNENRTIVAGKRRTEQGEEFDIMLWDRDDPRLKQPT